MDVGQNWLVLGLDLQLLQGAIMHLYKTKPAFQAIDGSVGTVTFRLELVAPVIEPRPACGDLPYRIGIHLLGDLYIAGSTSPARFDAWVRLEPDVVTDADGMPFGALVFDGVESIEPPAAKGELEKVFQPGGTVGDALAGLKLDFFTALLDAVTRVLHPPVDDDPDDDEEPPVDIDPNEFEVAFEVGEPASMRRPLYDVDDDGEPFLDIDWAFMTAPGLVASVALAGETAGMPGRLSMIKPSAGMTLLTSKTMFDAKLNLEAQAKIGKEEKGVTTDALALEAVDGGIAVEGKAHKTGGSVTFEGVVLSQYRGGTQGRLFMKPAIDTDVDLDWWVPYVGVGLFLVFAPLGAFYLAVIDVKQDGVHDTVNLSVGRSLREALAAAADDIAAGFGVESFPSLALLSDVWIVDGHLAVEVTAFLGVTSATVEGVTYDTAFVSKAGVRTNRRRPVRSIDTVTLSTGQTVTAAQIGKLVGEGMVEIPRHQAVRNTRAEGGWYIRSVGNDTTVDNLIR
jgi:hypothetical protein